MLNTNVNFLPYHNDKTIHKNKTLTNFNPTYLDPPSDFNSAAISTSREMSDQDLFKLKS